MAAIELRARGIYALPIEEEVIAVSDGRGGHLLYAPADWELYPYAPAAHYHRRAPLHGKTEDLRGRMPYRPETKLRCRE